MKMEKNGRNFCTGNSRHIHIRYFFIKDQVDAKTLEIVYCPTLQMLADYFTKPLQGKLFHLFRAVIMGWKHIDTLKQEPSSLPKERVGNMNNSDVSTGSSDDVTDSDGSDDVTGSDSSGDVTPRSSVVSGKVRKSVSYAQAVKTGVTRTGTPNTTSTKKK